MSIVQATFESDDALGAGGERWQLEWGSEPIFKYILPHTKPKDRILDLCSGLGRASFCFGLSGCDVTLWDHREDVLDNATYQADSLGYSVKTITANATELRTILVSRRFKVVLMLEALVHQPKTQAVRVITDACAVLEPGGYLYVDAPSTEDPLHDYFRKSNEQVDRDTYLEWCSCTGEYKREPFCFFYPGELALILKQSGMRTVFQASDHLEWQTLKTIAIAQKP